MRYSALLAIYAQLSGCILSVTPLSLDVSKQPWDDALEQAFDRLETTYAFTEHKQIAVLRPEACQRWRVVSEGDGWRMGGRG